MYFSNASNASNPISIKWYSYVDILNDNKNQLKIIEIILWMSLTAETAHGVLCHDAIPIKPAVVVNGPPTSVVQKPPTPVTTTAHRLEFGLTTPLLDSFSSPSLGGGIIKHGLVTTFKIWRISELEPMSISVAPHPLTCDGVPSNTKFPTRKIGWMFCVKVMVVELRTHAMLIRKKIIILSVV